VAAENQDGEITHSDLVLKEMPSASTTPAEPGDGSGSVEEIEDDETVREENS